MDRLPGLAGDAMEKTSAIDKIKKKIRGAKGTKRSFKMEIRLVQDVNQRRKYESRLGNLDQQLQTLVADCKAIEADHNRGELMAGGGNGENGDDHEGMSGEEAGDRMLNEANKIQDKTQDSLANTKNMIAQSKEVGMATLEELERQRGVLDNIDREAGRIDDNLARAEVLVRNKFRMPHTVWTSLTTTIAHFLPIMPFIFSFFSSNNLESAWPRTALFSVLR